MAAPAADHGLPAVPDGHRGARPGARTGCGPVGRALASRRLARSRPIGPDRRRSGRRLDARGRDDREAGTTLVEALGISRRGSHVIFAGLMACGLCFLSRHDTESGHWPILVVLIGGLTVPVCWRVVRSRFSDQATLRWATVLAWAIPTLALGAGVIPADHPVALSPLVRGLIARCRFAAVPIDDIERLAAWCRDNTPASARFIGPPGPKTFRLWSRRSLAFCRAGSPYHAAALADWFARFQDHVDLHLAASAFVKRYIGARHEMEARYEGLSDQQKAALALRQGANHVIAPVTAAAGSMEVRRESAA